MGKFKRFATSVLVAMALATAGQAELPDWSVPAADSVADTTLPARPDLDPTGKLDLLAATLASASRFERINQSQPDAAQLVFDLALNPQAAFDYFRDEITSAAYAGQLRDTSAVLVAGAGNPYDKAAALADILGRMGYDTQLVASASMASVAADGACAAPKTVDQDVLLLAGLGPPILDRIAARATASYLTLQPHLAPAATAAPPLPAHVWLQVRDGVDWIDLDPWTADSVWGRAPMQDGARLTDPPAPQTIEVRVLVETLKDGALRESEVLSASFWMPDAAEDWVSLTFGPEVEGLGGILSQSLGNIQGLAQPMRAVLTTNGHPKSSSTFSAPGVPSATTDLFAESVVQVTTAISLELRSVASAGSAETVRRSIIDLIPAALRLSHADGTLIKLSDVETPTQGDRYPAALESLRNIVMSNGGMSRRQTAARAVRDLLALPETMRRVAGGQPDMEAMLWTTWLQARRAALVSEELIQLRPHHNGSCVRVISPRIEIWGLSNDGDDRLLQWFDWAHDSVGVVGGDAQSQAEVRLWHGAVQSALETEALAWMTLAPTDLFAMDLGPMVPLDGARLEVAGQEAVNDQNEGFLTLADARTAPGYWWRLNPLTGQADARAGGFGNAKYVNPYSSYTNASKGGTSSISEAEMAKLERDVARFGKKGFYKEIGRLQDIRNAGRPVKKVSVKEYIISMINISIPGGIAVSTGIGIAVLTVLGWIIFG